jgi:hypothetical protein
MWWHTVMHGQRSEGETRMVWVTSKHQMTAEHRLARAVQTLQADVYSSPASSRLNWPPANLNGLVRFTERRNQFSAHVPSHFKCSLPQPHFSVVPIVSVQNKAPWIMQILVHKAFLSLPTAVLPSSTSDLHPQQSNVLVATEGYHDCHCQHVCRQNH